MESETKEFVQLVRLYAVKEKELTYGKKELNDSAKVVELSRQILKNQDREYILAIAMDARTKPVAVEIVAIGSVKRSVGIKKRRYFVHRFSGQTEQEQRTYQTGITVVSESWNTVEDIRFADITNRSTGRARMDTGYGK